MSAGPIFIVGCPRSGTGLLRDLLRSHPNLTFPFESVYLPGLYRAHGDPANQHAARRLGRTMLSLEQFRKWKLDLTPDDFAECRTFRSAAEQLYGVWMRREGKPRWGDKTPYYTTELETLLTIFPDARFLHLVRDGRDVALSVRRVGFGPCTVYGAARWWQRIVSAGLRNAERLPPGTCLEVRYEDVLATPEATLRTVCAFVGEPFDPAVLRRNTLSVGPWPVASYTVIVPDNAEKWRDEMTVAERAMFEVVAGDLLAELGYEVAGSRRRRLGAPETAWRRADDLARRSLGHLRRGADRHWIRDRARIARAALAVRLRRRPRYDSPSSRSAASTE